MFLTSIYILFSLIFTHSFCLEADNVRRYNFVVKEAPYTRLCETKTILTVNGEYPGPTIEAHAGETIIVDVVNNGKYNITLHWHGVWQPRYPWSDGPEYVNQCPIQPGKSFSQKVIFTTEEGTLWWHAHSDWYRATVHGAILVYPTPGTSYPFPNPTAQIPIILGEWWKEDIMKVMNEFVTSGGQLMNSDAYTINGQPGDLYPCSTNDRFQTKVLPGKTYLLRIINANMNEILFFGVAGHNLTVVGTDGCYTKPLSWAYIVISPGQTVDCLLEATQEPNHYYMSARPYVDGVGATFDNSSATGILQYEGRPYAPTSPPELPNLPLYNDTASALNFIFSLRSLHPAAVPAKIDKRIVSTISVNALRCDPSEKCAGPNGTRLAASMNNVSFVNPPIDILEAYFYQISGVFGKNFPDFPPVVFNYTADFIPFELGIPRKGTEVRMLRYNSNIEIVFQGTNLVAGIDHPMHLHGYSFYIVGWGFGNFDEHKDPLNYNLVDPPNRNTVIVPRNGWAAIRFTANNPGVWFLHCHFERHLTWGMETVFIVRNGRGQTERVLPPPPDMPPC